MGQSRRLETRSITCWSREIQTYQQPGSDDVPCISLVYNYMCPQVAVEREVNSTVHSTINNPNAGQFPEFQTELFQGLMLNNTVIFMPSGQSQLFGAAGPIGFPREVPESAISIQFLRTGTGIILRVPSGGLISTKNLTAEQRFNRINYRVVVGQRNSSVWKSYHACLEFPFIPYYAVGVLRP